jgi:hypothetical protein
MQFLAGLAVVWAAPQLFQTSEVSQQLMGDNSRSKKTLVFFLCGIGTMLWLNAVVSAQTVQTNPQVIPTLHFDVSPPLRDIKPAIVPRKKAEAEPARLIPRPRAVAGLTDTALQRSYAPKRLMPSLSNNFMGLGNGFSGYAITSAPPDTNMAVGPSRIVQIVNTDFAVFDKTGATVLAPRPINAVWAGFGGGCEANNDGDPVAEYDRIADRWIISQFSVATTPFLECVAVSTSSDPTGSYTRYAFDYGDIDFPDYPKLGVWPDAYYITYNIFDGNAFAEAKICALDRTSMLAGVAATQQCFNTSSNYGGVLPADLDGSRPPPAGSANYLLALGVSNNDLAFWKFHVDWTTPGNSTLTGPTTLTIDAYNPACNAGVCIPQTGTSQQLDSLADRLMYRLAYRNFGDHEALVVNHSVTAGSGTGVRWYEVRSPGGTPTVFQQGTYAPDSDFRWMGSIAMDQEGNMGLGFSLSGNELHPEIHYTGRLVGDAAGQMPQGEGTIINGAGSQTGNNLSRWGDYSAMRIDPSDDCTFWYTTEYIPSDGSFNWSTQIASFKFPSCGVVFAANPPTINKSFGAASIALGLFTSLSFTIHNPNAGASLSGIGFNDPLPSGLVVANPNGLTGSCGGGTITANAGSTSVSLSGATLAASASCAFSVNLQALQIGTKNNFTTAVTSTEGGPGNAGTATLIVNQASTTTTVTSSSNPSVSGQSVTFTATVLSGGGTPTGTVTFLDGGNTIGTVTLDAGGAATFATSTLAVGNHTITTNYAGDTNFTGSTGSLTGNPQVVNQADTVTAVTSSVNPSVIGQSITFTATVSAVAPGAGTPSGLVFFSDGGSVFGFGSLDASGVTTFATSLDVGSHTITANYSGNGNLNASTGSMTGNPQVVNKADTTTALTSSANPSAVGQSVTFTATVSPVAPGVAFTTGSVTFLDGAASIGTGTLGTPSANQATFTTSLLTAGPHNITAQYGGNCCLNSSTSPVLLQGVGGADIAVTLTHRPDPAAIGGTLVFTATVTNNGPTSANVTFAQTFTGASNLVSAGLTQGTGTCSGTRSISCALPTMANGDVRQVTIVVTPLLGRNVVATATVTPDLTDPITSNNTATSTARIRFKPQRF